MTAYNFFFNEAALWSGACGFMLIDDVFCFACCGQVIAGMLEAASVGLCILVVLKLGLKVNLVVYMLVAGCACLMVNFIADGNNVGLISLAMIGKCTLLFGAF